MEVETTDKIADRRGGSKTDMIHKATSPIPARTLKIAGVQLKIVGESLNILKDYKESLELTCVAEGAETCRISFIKGSHWCRK